MAVVMNAPLHLLECIDCELAVTVVVEVVMVRFRSVLEAGEARRISG